MLKSPTYITATILCIFGLISPTIASAKIYEYTGTDYSLFGTFNLKSDYDVQYDASDKVTLTLEVSTAAKIIDLSTIIAWYASDGIRGFNEKNATLNGSFSLDGNGNVASWSFRAEILALPDPSTNTGYILESCGPSNCQSSILYNHFSPGDYVQTTNNALGDYLATSITAGAWTVSDGAPEVSTWTMILLGFAGLSFAGYRVKPKSASSV